MEILSPLISVPLLILLAKIFGFAFWTTLIFQIGFKTGKKYEAGFYRYEDRMVEDEF